MGIKYVLTPELRIELKKPLGTLIKGPSAATMKKLKEKAAKDNPPIVVSVGDTVSKNLYRYNFRPNLAIVDNKRMRRNVQTTELQATKIIHVQNPQGTLTEEAINATREAIEDKNSVEIVVDGEEDLLALIAIAYAPQNSYIVYGQPLEGIVVVKATPDKKAEIAAILGAMEKGSKN
jgi:GTP-dependent dephospho-CoA kinase